MSTDSTTVPTPAAARPAAPETMTGAQAVVRSLEMLGIRDVFGLPGGAILPVYDPLLDAPDINHILVRHEQGAGHAAEGYASATGKVGVAIATSGPGATNLVTAIADAHMDSVPLLAITGQVFSNLMGTDAFQEADIVGITMPVTKHSFLVKRAEEIPGTIAAAYHIASTGRPGPVLVDITKDAQQDTLEFSWPPKVDLPGYRPITRAHGKQVQAAIRAAREGDWTEQDGVVVAGGIELVEGEYELALVSGDADTESRAIGLLPGDGFVLLETATTPELEAEGLARDAVRAVQDARKAAGLEVSDRIRLRLVTEAHAAPAFEAHRVLIADETLAVAFDVAVDGLGDEATTLAGGAKLAVEVTRA